MMGVLRGVEFRLRIMPDAGRRAAPWTTAPGSGCTKSSAGCRRSKGPNTGTGHWLPAFPQPARVPFISYASTFIQTRLAGWTKVRLGTVFMIYRDAAQGGYCVRFIVFNRRRGDTRCTVRTDPPLDVKRTRWLGKTVEVVTPELPPWKAGDAVMLTLEPPPEPPRRPYGTR